MHNNDTQKIAIIHTCRNRPEFLERLVKYYIKNNCPHVIYVADRSNTEENRRKYEEVVKKLGDKIEINYHQYSDQEVPGATTARTLKLVKEKFVCLNGDDDYQISDALIKCAEFLEQNPDYSTACGYAVNFCLNQSGAYGELAWLKNYPRPEINDNTASSRIINYFSNYFVPIISVNRTEQMRKNWEKVHELPDLAFASEILPAALSIIDGKTKTLDCLGTVRQMHDLQFGLPFYFYWMTSPEWLESYNKTRNILTERLAAKDEIDLVVAKKTIEQGFWIYLQKQMTREYPEAFPENIKRDLKKVLLKKIRHIIAASLPFTKTIYRSYWHPMVRGRKEMHYEVTWPFSKYYKDFKLVKDSFTNNNETTY